LSGERLVTARLRSHVLRMSALGVRGRNCSKY
jgi:hypothetical protein